MVPSQYKRFTAPTPPTLNAMASDSQEEQLIVNSTAIGLLYLFYLFHNELISHLHTNCFTFGKPPKSCLYSHKGIIVLALLLRVCEVSRVPTMVPSIQLIVSLSGNLNGRDVLKSDAIGMH